MLRFSMSYIVVALSLLCAAGMISTTSAWSSPNCGRPLQRRRVTTPAAAATATASRHSSGRSYFGIVGVTAAGASSKGLPDSAEETPTTSPPVKCPDCDLCDGSGR